jgi:hypothetical protein
MRDWRGEALVIAMHRPRYRCVRSVWTTHCQAGSGQVQSPFHDFHTTEAKVTFDPKYACFCRRTQALSLTEAPRAEFWLHEVTSLLLACRISKRDDVARHAGRMHFKSFLRAFNASRCAAPSEAGCAVAVVRYRMSPPVESSEERGLTTAAAGAIPSRLAEDRKLRRGHRCDEPIEYLARRGESASLPLTLSELPLRIPPRAIDLCRSETRVMTPS